MTTMEVAKKIADTLIADTGYHVTVDSRDVRPPCILIQPPAITLNRFCGGQADYKLHILVPGPWNADAWNAADDMLAKVLRSDAVTLTQVEPNTIANPDNSQASAYTCTFTQAVDL